MSILGRRGNGNDDKLVEIREMALVRVMEMRRKEKRQKEDEILKEKMMQQEKRSALQLKHSQKERQRAEIYASIGSLNKGSMNSVIDF
jgi:hypothetical protein